MLKKGDSPSKTSRADYFPVRQKIADSG